MLYILLLAISVLATGCGGDATVEEPILYYEGKYADALTTQDYATQLSLVLSGCGFSVRGNPTVSVVKDRDVIYREFVSHMSDGTEKVGAVLHDMGGRTRLVLAVFQGGFSNNDVHDCIDKIETRLAQLDREYKLQ